MILYIVRHATPSETDDVGDLYRPLIRQGIVEATQMAARVSSHLSGRPGLILTSPAVRAYATAMLFAGYFNHDAKNLGIIPAIYEASYHALVRVINSIQDEHNIVFLFGHNPGLSDVVNYLCGGGFAGLPRCGVAELKMNVKSWRDAGEKTATLANTFFP